MTGKTRKRNEFELFLRTLHANVSKDEPKLVKLINAKNIAKWESRSWYEWLTESPFESYPYVGEYIKVLLDKVHYNTELCEFTLSETDMWYISDAIQISERLVNLEMSDESK